MCRADAVAKPRVDESVVRWSKLIWKHARAAGEGGEALALFRRMREEGVIPNSCTFLAALKACSTMAELRAVHGCAAEAGTTTDVPVANTLLHMYARLGSIATARRIFDHMPVRSAVSWNTLILAYANMAMGPTALALYSHMHCHGFVPTHHTFVAALKACTALAPQGQPLPPACLHHGRTIHAQITQRGLESDIYVANALIDMYAKCGCVDNARRVFDRMGRRDCVTLTAMITGYVQVDRGDLGLELYARMQQVSDFVPDACTFSAVLKACASLAAQGEDDGEDGKILRANCLETGRTIHADVVKRRLHSDAFIQSSLVDMYAKCGSIKDARHVFGTMRHRDVVSWTAMIMGYAQMQMGDVALNLYAQMQEEGIRPDTFTFVAALKACGSLASQEEAEGRRLKVWHSKGRAFHDELAERGFESNIFVANTLIDMYAKCGSMEDARHVFESMRYRNAVSWNVMIMAYAQIDLGGSALALYYRMQDEGFTPDALTFVGALKACGSLSSLEAGKQIHAQICKVGLQAKSRIPHSLIDMYGKCGSMADAQQFFDSLPVRNSVTWNSLMAGYSGQGDSDCTFDLYVRMQEEGIKPDCVTFVSVLSVCSHNGLVDKGRMCFQAMCFKHGLSPCNIHFSCMSDLLGRAGQLDEALAMVKKMPFKPDIATCMTVLNACQKWSNVETGRHVFECVVMLDEKYAAGYGVMLNIYLSCKMWDESSGIQEMRVKAGASMEAESVQLDGQR